MRKKLYDDGSTERTIFCIGQAVAAFCLIAWLAFYFFDRETNNAVNSWFVYNFHLDNDSTSKSGTDVSVSSKKNQPRQQNDLSERVQKIATLKGHSNRIGAVAFSPDGKYAITGSGDSTAKLWSIPDGACIKTLAEHIYFVSSVAFSPDGRYVVTGSLDSNGAIWSMPDGECIKMLKGHTSYIMSMAISRDGKYVLTGSDDETAKVWSVPEGECLESVNLGYVVNEIAFSPDGKYVLFGAGTRWNGNGYDTPAGGFVATLYEWGDSENTKDAGGSLE